MYIMCIAHYDTKLQESRDMTIINIKSQMFKKYFTNQITCKSDNNQNDTGAIKGVVHCVRTTGHICTQKAPR